MYAEFKVDVICLSELKAINGSMETALAKWTELVAAKPGRKPLMERMMLELVDNRADWIAVAFAHCGLLVNTRKDFG